MMKFAWDLVSKHDCLWVNIMRDKYGYGNKIIPDVKSKIKPLTLGEVSCKFGINLSKI